MRNAHLHDTQPDEYEKLGSYALIGLPDDLYTTRWVMSSAGPTLESSFRLI